MIQGCQGIYRKYFSCNVPKMEYNIRLEVCMNYLTADEAAKKWGISGRRVRILCNEGRVKGAEQKGNLWLIPDNVEKPERYKRGIKHDATSCG